MKFRKKPVVVDAVQWSGDNLKEVIDLIGLHSSAHKWTWEEYESVVKSEGLKIFTLEGTMMANIGDWIIVGVNGEVYPCKPDIFEKTYEEALDVNPKEPRYIDFDSFVNKYKDLLKYDGSPTESEKIVPKQQSDAAFEEPFYRTNAIGFDPTKETPYRGLL